MLKVAMTYVTECKKSTANKKKHCFNRHAYSFFVFDSKKERDEWVDKTGRNFIVHGNIIVHSVDDLYE